MSLQHAAQDTPIWVSAVALVNERGEVLVQQRPPSGAHAGLWEFPGGKLEGGESCEAAAIRELHEELGIAIDAKHLLPVAFATNAHDREPGDRPLAILLFACAQWEGEAVAHAASALAWVGPGELASWAMPPLDYPLARALARLLQDGSI